jgi:pimeloyl-ACP methyl ester carboxylesterase
MKAEIPGITLDYDDVGSGSPVLLIHGFPFDRRIWEAQIAGLSKQLRVVAPDLRGHGASDAPPGPYSMEAFARDLFGLMDHAGISRFAAAGHSMGGYILFAMHRTAPERLTRLALVTTRAIADDEAGRKNREVTALRLFAEGTPFLAEVMAERLLTDRALPPVAARFREIILSQRPVGLAGSLRAMAERPDAGPQLPSIGAPTLVVAGAQDRLVSLEESRAMASAIPGSRLVALEGAGHLPSLEQPEATTRTLAEFFREE